MRSYNFYAQNAMVISVISLAVLLVLAVIGTGLSTFYEKRKDIKKSNLCENIVFGIAILCMVGIVSLIGGVIWTGVAKGNMHTKIDNNELNQTVLTTTRINAISEHKDMYVIDETGEITRLKKSIYKIYISDDENSYLKSIRFDDGSKYIDENILYLNENDFKIWTKE